MSFDTVTAVIIILVWPKEYRSNVNFTMLNDLFLSLYVFQLKLIKCDYIFVRLFMFNPQPKPQFHTYPLRITQLYQLNKQMEEINHDLSQNRKELAQLHRKFSTDQNQSNFIARLTQKNMILQLRKQELEEIYRLHRFHQGVQNSLKENNKNIHKMLNQEYIREIQQHRLDKSKEKAIQKQRQKQLLQNSYEKWVEKQNERRRIKTPKQKELIQKLYHLKNSSNPINQTAKTQGQFTHSYQTNSTEKNKPKLKDYFNVQYQEVPSKQIPSYLSKIQQNKLRQTPEVSKIQIDCKNHRQRSGLMKYKQVLDEQQQLRQKLREKKTKPSAGKISPQSFFIESTRHKSRNKEERLHKKLNPLIGPVSFNVGMTNPYILLDYERKVKENHKKKAKYDSFLY